MTLSSSPSFHCCSIHQHRRCCHHHHHFVVVLVIVVISIIIIVFVTSFVWSSLPQATNLKPEKDDKNEDDTTSEIIMIMIVIKERLMMSLRRMSKSREEWFSKINIHILACIYLCLMGIHRCHHHHQHPPPKQHHHHHHHHHQPAPHLHHIQIRPLRADLDVQRVGKAGEEKENHSEGDFSKGSGRENMARVRNCPDVTI